MIEDKWHQFIVDCRVLFQENLEIPITSTLSSNIELRQIDNEQNSYTFVQNPILVIQCNLVYAILIAEEYIMARLQRLLKNILQHLRSLNHTAPIQSFEIPING